MVEQQKAGIDLQVAQTNLQIKQVELAIKKEEASLSLQTKAAESQIKLDGQRYEGRGRPRSIRSEAPRRGRLVQVPASFAGLPFKSPHGAISLDRRRVCGPIDG